MAALEQVAPGLRRLLAPNPSPFTFNGTQTYVVGEGDVAVIDPGPDEPSHVGALVDALAGERVTAILVTHTHRDHSPAARPLAGATGAPIIGCAPLVPPVEAGAPDAEFDRDYGPDEVLPDGGNVAGRGWTLTAVATPGHASNHLCFAWPEVAALFSGDHVMGWSTSIVSPPDGDMGDYLASLQRLLLRDDRIYYPTHGPEILAPHEHVRRLIAHRRAREAGILAELAAGPRTAGSLVLKLYADVPPLLHPAAERSVLAHLLELKRCGRTRADGDQWSLL